MRHSVYKVDTGAADEIEPVSQSSPGLLHSPISLSHITGITIDDSSPSRRPQVDYTQGMYCEIVIPDEAGSDQPSLFDGSSEVPVRRTSCK